MEFKAVYDKIKDVPFIEPSNARAIYDFILETKPAEVLELGFAHGTSSCYIAAALKANNHGRLTCVDLHAVRDQFKPSIEEQLKDLGLSDIVEIHRMQSGYNWFLHDKIKEQSNNTEKVCKPVYDLIIIDGPKNWTIDSSSFFLCDKLLKQNGWIIWDDYNWTYAQADKKRDVTDGISHRSMSDEEIRIPHIREVFQLLVMQHPDYGEFKVQEDSDWAWARKIRQEVKSIEYSHSQTFQSYVITGIKKALRKI